MGAGRAHLESASARTAPLSGVRMMGGGCVHQLGLEWATAVLRVLDTARAGNYEMVDLRLGGARQCIGTRKYRTGREGGYNYVSRDVPSFQIKRARLHCWRLAGCSSSQTSSPLSPSLPTHAVIPDHAPTHSQNAHCPALVVLRTSYTVLVAHHKSHACTARAPRAGTGLSQFPGAHPVTSCFAPERSTYVNGSAHGLVRLATGAPVQSAANAPPTQDDGNEATVVLAASTRRTYPVLFFTASARP